jgi:hypothetical protein
MDLPSSAAAQIGPEFTKMEGRFDRPSIEGLTDHGSFRCGVNLRPKQLWHTDQEFEVQGTVGGWVRGGLTLK